MIHDKYKPLLEEQENRKKKLHRIRMINYVISILIICSSISILLLNLFSKSDFQMRLIVGITQSIFGIILAFILTYITYKRNKKIVVAYNITSGIMGLTFDAFILFLIIQYSKNDNNYSQSQIELKDVILGCIFTITQTFSLFISIYFLIRMKKINKLCKKFNQEDHFQVSLQEDQRSSSPVQSTQPKQIKQMNQNMFIADKETTKKEVSTDNKQQIDFFENCSQYTDSLLSDIENSLPNKKKIALKSIDALQNTDSDAPNQTSQATKSERNNSQSHHHQTGKYMSIQKNDQIFEGDEEDEDEQEDYQVHNKILTPGNGNSEFQQFCDKSLSNPMKEQKRQKNTQESKSYYNTTIDLGNNS